VLVQITTSYYCAGAIIEDDRVVAAAPILRGYVGWHRDRLLKHIHERGDKIEIVL
jgi:hypothetical protein